MKYITRSRADRMLLKEQAHWLAKQLGKDYAEIHLELAPRLLTGDELVELIAELKSYIRFLVEEILAGTAEDPLEQRSYLLDGRRHCGCDDGDDDDVA